MLGILLLSAVHISNCKLQKGDIIGREMWNAAEPKRIFKINNSVQYVVILHTDDPGACWETEDCKDTMYQMQIHHQGVKKFDDIHMK